MNWIKVCRIDDIAPDSGVCALVDREQIAVFRLANNDVFAIGNYDPFSGANVLSRGIVGDKNGVVKIASPIYKQNFSLETGACLDDASIVIPVYPARCENGLVLVGSPDAS